MSITPRIKEHVVKELEVMKPCEVAEEFEQLLIQEVRPTELQAPELEPCGVIEEVEQLLTQEEFTITLIHPSQTLAPKEDFSLPPLLQLRETLISSRKSRR